MRRSQPKKIGISEELAEIQKRSDQTVRSRDLTAKCYNTTPTLFTTEFVEEFLERVACGETIRSISKREGMPSEYTIRKYLSETPSFKEAYDKAKNISADILADELLEIADDDSNDLLFFTDKDGIEQVKPNSTATKRAELKIKTRQWILARLRPQEFSDKYMANDNPNAKGINMSGSQIQIILPDNGRTIDVE